jgi:hypothetical protein
MKAQAMESLGRWVQMLSVCWEVEASAGRVDLSI